MKAARSTHQEPIQPNDTHHGGDGGQSLRAGSDLAPYKPRTDIVVVGSAYAPGGRPTRELTARIVIGECEKVVEVVADRSLGIDGTVYEGPAFKSMPLVYERAAGGPDTWNPVGVSRRMQDSSGRLRLPNLLPPGAPHDSPDVAPIGFGPVAPSWSARVDWLGAHASRWRHGVYGEELVVPDDLDLRYFNFAPGDQQLSTPVGSGAHLLFDCLTASGSRLSTYLPELTPFAVATLGSRQEKLPMTADTFVVDSDRATCTITYRAVFPLQSAHEQISVAIIDGNTPLNASVRPAIENEHSKTPELETMIGTAAADGPTMPFQKHGGPQVVVRPPGDTGLPFGQTGAQPAASKPMMQLGSVPSFQTVEVPLNVPSLPVPPAPPPPAPPPPPRSTPGLLAPPPVSSSVGPSAIAPPTPHPPPVSMPALAPPMSMPVSAPAPIPAPAPVPAPAPIPAPAPVPSAGSSTGGATSSGVPLRSMLLQGATEAQQPTYLKSAEANLQKPAMVAVGHAARAAKDGALAASDAAAGTTATKSTPPPKLEQRAVQPTEPPPAADLREYLEVIWSDPEAVQSAKRSRTFRDLFVDKKVRRGLLTAPEEASTEGKERAELSKLLSTARAYTDLGSVELALAGALDEHGSLEPPHVVVSGDLIILLDDRVLLEAICGIIQPLLAKDKALAEAHELAKTALEGTWTLPRSIDQALKKLREALSKDVQGGIEQSARRQVLERKDLDQRAVLGAQHIRASLAFTDTQSMTIYLPQVMKDRLPLYERFPVRILATVHPRQDPQEASQSALVAEAVARRLPRPGQK